MKSRRAKRQARWGLASICFSTVGLLTLMGGAVTHDLGYGVAVTAAIWAVTAGSIIGAIVCCLTAYDA